MVVGAGNCGCATRMVQLRILHCVTAHARRSKKIGLVAGRSKKIGFPELIVLGMAAQTRISCCFGRVENSTLTPGIDSNTSGGTPV